MAQRGRIVALATVVIPPANTPEKKKTETLIATPRWKYVGPACTINFEWQIGRWNSTFNGITARKYDTRSQPASTELKEFSTNLTAIPLSGLSPGYYDCEIWFKSSAFSDLRVIVQNCVKIAEVKQYSLDVWISPTGSGSVQKSPDKAKYDEGEKVTLTAIDSNPDYQWLGYTGDVASTSKIITVTINRNLWIVAQWTLKPPPPPPPVYMCPHCGATFSTQAGLDDHIKSQHPPQELYIVYFKDGSTTIMTGPQLAATWQVCMYQPDFCGIVRWERYYV